MTIAIIIILLILAILVAQTDKTGFMKNKNSGRLSFDDPFLTGFAIVIFFIWLFTPQNFFAYAAIAGLVTFIAYVIVINSNNSTSTVRTGINSSANRAERLKALSEAYIYLAPYNDIWRNLRLVNKFIVLTLGLDGKTIACEERVHPFRKLRVINPGVHTHEDLWNMFCKYFSHNKYYNGVKEDCERFGVKYIETNVPNTTETAKPVVNNTAIISNSTKIAPKEKVDINNCSEIELTELPGVSIVYAKKVIKKREEIGGFKTVDEFFLFLKLKPHMINQLRELVKVEKMRGYVRKHLDGERSVDF